MRYLVEFSLPDEDSPVTGETGETGEARVTSVPADGKEDLEAVDSEGMQTYPHIQVELSRCSTKLVSSNTDI